MNIILSAAYFPPIQFFSKIIHADNILIERYENYQKQTYRNRCIIFGANGPLNLTFPVTKCNELKVYTKDIKIDYALQWIKIHKKAIESAYKNSPYYQYYIDEIFPILDEKYTFLYDLNFMLLKSVSRLIGINITINETNEYIHNYGDSILDYRERIHPKKNIAITDQSFIPPVYHQVFHTKYGFQKNLSIIDLLFNTGPDCKDHLLNSLNN